ncbi:MAG TPA: LPXTG cell wall anchor domain-containing protein [Thermoanaerobaculia bacterium]|jgi:LPXTG-motif cell wall-anchored protein
MRRLVKGVSLFIGLALLGGIALAQEQDVRTEIRNGKVVYVAPGTLAVRGKNGVRIFTKADWKDIKVEKDGKVIDPDQLHKGDVVTATIITATEPPTPTAEQMKTYEIAEEAGTGDMTSERIIWTEIKKGKVRAVGPTDLLVKTDTGLRHFTKDEWKDTKIWKDGQAITPDQLHVGDVITATFITKATPTITEQQATQYESKPAPAPPAPRPAPKAAPAPAPAPAAASAAEPAKVAAAPAVEHKKLPKTASSVPAVGLAGLAFLGLGLALSVSRRSRRAS